jgi:hypothetical protein
MEVEHKIEGVDRTILVYIKVGDVQVNAKKEKSICLTDFEGGWWHE